MAGSNGNPSRAAQPDCSSAEEVSQPIGFHLLRWAIGFVIATALIWAIAWFFLDSIRPHVLEPHLARYVAPAGSNYRFRSEGWAVTHYGKYGIAAIPDIGLASEPKIALWGDSFVEAPHVADSLKMAQQVTAIWNRKHSKPLLAVGIGRGDRTVADYHFLLPWYEELTPFLCHIIVMGSLRDVCPDGIWFVTQPEYGFVSRQRRQPLPELRLFLDRYRLEFLWTPYWSLVGEKRNPLTHRVIRFHLGPLPVASPHHRWTWQNLEQVDSEAWNFAVQSLSRRTSVPVVFLYAPRVPYIDSGQIIRDHPARDHALRFAEICRHNGSDFIDLTDRFVAFYDETGQFPIGFANSQYGKGHYNKYGHRLIAEEVCDYVADRFPELRAERYRELIKEIHGDLFED